MLLIATSVICATFQFVLLFALLALVTVLLCVQRYVPRLMGQKRQNGVLLLTVPAEISPEGQKALLKVLERHLARGRVQGISVAEGLTTIHYGFNDLAVEQINEVQKQVEEVAPIERMNVFFNRQGALT